jgi:hypothetical protein
MILFRMIDRVARNFYNQIFLSHKRLAREPRIGLQSPRAIKQIFFVFIELIERVEALSHDNVAGSTGAAHVAGVLDVDAVLQQHLANAVARIGFDFCAVGADFYMGEDFDDGHDVYKVSTVLPVSAR